MASDTSHLPVFSSFLNPSPPPQRPLSPRWEYLLHRRGRVPRSVSVGEQFLRFKGKEARRKTKLWEKLDNDDLVVEVADGEDGWATYASRNPNQNEKDGGPALTETEPTGGQLAVPTMEPENGTGGDNENDDGDWEHDIFTAFLLEFIRRRDARRAARQGHRGNTGVASGNIVESPANDAQTDGNQEDDIDQDDVDYDDFVVVSPRPLFADTPVHENRGPETTGEPSMPIADPHRTPISPGVNQQPPVGNNYPAHTRSLGIGPRLLPALPVFPAPQHPTGDQDRGTPSTHNPELRGNTRTIAPPPGFTKEDERLDVS